MPKRVCPHCRKKVHYKATACPYCTRSLEPVSFWKTGSGRFLILIGILWLFGVIAQSIPEKEQTKPQKQVQNEVETPERAISKLTATQLIEEAKKALADGYKPNNDITKTTLGRVADAEIYLNAIKNLENDAQRTEVEKLRKEIERRNKEIEKASKIVAEKMFVRLRSDRISLVSTLTKEHRQDGWDGLIFEATGNDKKTIKMTFNKFQQGTRLTEGELVSILGTILTPNIVSRLKNVEFEKGEFVDGKKRSYDFEISRQYFDKMQEVYKSMTGGR